MNQREEALHILCAMLAGREKPRPNDVISFLGVLEAVAPAKTHPEPFAGRAGGSDCVSPPPPGPVHNDEHGTWFRVSAGPYDNDWSAAAMIVPAENGGIKVKASVMKKENPKGYATLLQLSQGDTFRAILFDEEVGENVYKRLKNIKPGPPG